MDKFWFNPKIEPDTANRVSPRQSHLMTHPMEVSDLYDPGFAESPDGLKAWADFVAIVRHLRRKCPWDREQTHESVKHMLIEETFEAIDAIDRDDPRELSRELGDVLLHVAFHSAIAEESGSFRLIDVIRQITEKLVRRHPHVFADTEVDGVAEVLTNWERIKMDEGGRKSVLDGVPRALPSLLRAHRIQEKAAAVGFDFATPDAAWTKVEEELSEYRRADAAAPSEREAELGDVLFSIVNYARLSGLNAENALRIACNRFDTRFGFVERILAEQGRSPRDASLKEMDALWEKGKRMMND